MESKPKPWPRLVTFNRYGLTEAEIEVARQENMRINNAVMEKFRRENPEMFGDDPVAEDGEAALDGTLDSTDKNNVDLAGMDVIAEDVDEK